MIFTQNKAGTFWPWQSFTSFSGWKIAHDTVEMDFSNIKNAWTKRCRFDALIYWHLFVFNQIPLTFTLSALSMHILILCNFVTRFSEVCHQQIFFVIITWFLHCIDLSNNQLEKQICKKGEFSGSFATFLRNSKLEMNILGKVLVTIMHKVICKVICKI